MSNAANPLPSPHMPQFAHRQSQSAPQEAPGPPAGLGKRRSVAVRNCLIVIASIAAIWTLQWAKLFLIPLAVAAFITFWLLPMVDTLQRLHVPRSLGAAFVLATLLFAGGYAGYALRDDAGQFLNGVAKAAQHTRIAYDRAARDPNGWLHHVRSAITDKNPSTPHSRNENILD